MIQLVFTKSKRRQNVFKAIITDSIVRKTYHIKINIYSYLKETDGSTRKKNTEGNNTKKDSTSGRLINNKEAERAIRRKI